MSKRTVLDLRPSEMKGKRAVVRVDFNVPLDGARITDDTRISAVIPTLNALIAGGARIVLLSHLGRPNGTADAKYSLAPCAVRLGELLKKPVKFFAETNTDAAVAATQQLADGEILLLENTRFLVGEETNDEALAKSLVDSNLETEIKNLYCCDASVFPSALGLPVIWTAVALGKRLGKHLDTQLSR